MTPALLLMVLVGVLLGGVQTLGALLGERGVSTSGIVVVLIVGYGSQVVLTPRIARSTAPDRCRRSRRHWRPPVWRWS